MSLCIRRLQPFKENDMTITRKFGSKNMREIHFPDGSSIVFSYTTPVVVVDEKGNIFVTTEKYSTTTTRQINFFLNTARQEGRINSNIERRPVPQDIINMMVAQIRNRNPKV